MINSETENGIEKININLLNQCIEANRKNMKPMINYGFIEQVSRAMVQNIKMKNQRDIVPVVLFSREEAISIVLKFFESLGNQEWYQKVKGIILGQDKDIGINIFREEDITDLSEKNEDGLRKYSNGSQLEYKGNGYKALVKILLNDEFSDVKNSMPSDKFTIQDIYSIVHETSHTFDLGKTKRSIERRELFAEVTPYCFERIFGEYLVQNNIISERIVDKIEQKMTQRSVRHARAVCAKMALVQLKEKEGMLNKDNIKEMLEKNGIRNPLYVKSMLVDVLESPPVIDFDAKYAIAEITMHQYMKKYRNNKEEAMERLKIYCEAVKRGDMDEETFRIIGCPIDEQEVEKAINDMGEQINR